MTTRVHPFLGRARSRGVLFTVLVTLLLLLASPAEASAQTTTIAIVVNPETPVADVSFARLRKIFMGEEQFWEGSRRITLLVRAPVASERDVVLKVIYGMNEAQFRQFWIAKLFRAEVTSGPKIVYSTAMAGQLVTALPGAITFMPASAVGDLKVLRVDGKLPGEAGYKLR